MTLNPIYESAPFELGYVPTPEIPPDPHPLRFLAKDVKAAQEHMENGEMDKVVALSIPKWLP